ncbi:hypothetical protein M011DRAFT_409358 [Sporormia fimetaria CBS 119925]|uniref:Uncharacterized protein n=1 Tax=Sporormia fimetaria CBS 119925 TaxID=1340428 RepID=A0A6A6V2D4_9PLEO|nr:hypothetical protein M011DRAFT_409358 [Sporormia fimetaria CBS 119925]
MTTVISGGFGANGTSSGTEFMSMLPPPGDALKEWDNTKPYDQQPASIPQIFKDAMSVRENVFGEQSVPLDAEFDEDDARSWHWVVYASVASTSRQNTDNAEINAQDTRRSSSATAQRLPVGTIRLVPPPHGPNKYVHGDKHPDAEPPAFVTDSVAKRHPNEPYIKLGRLAVLSDYRRMGLSNLLIKRCLDHTTQNPGLVCPPPSPTKLEKAIQQGHADANCIHFRGLAMVHAQVSVMRLWKKHGFAEELYDGDGNVEISKEEHWMEEGIEHVGMWRRLNVTPR